MVSSKNLTKPWLWDCKQLCAGVDVGTKGAIVSVPKELCLPRRKKECGGRGATREK